MVRTIPAMPGSEKVKPNMAIIPNNMIVFTIRPMMAMKPETR